MAFHLKIPVYKLLNEMPYDELLGWFDYFERRPVDWRADLRMSYSLQAQGVKEKATKLFPSLVAISKREDDGSTVSKLKGSMMHHKLLGAVGGTKLEFL